MPRQRTAFVGREAETRVLRGELDAALRGEGRLVSLLGEPGIGKTRTAAWLATEAEAGGALAVWGRCRAQRGSPECWPWIQVLRACAEADSEPAESAMRQLRWPPDDSEPARTRFDRFDAATRALVAVARARPLVVVLDDLQWADAESLRLLEFAVPELSLSPALLVAIARAGERPEGGALPLALGRTVSLEGLSRAESVALLANEMEREPEPSLAAEVQRVTGGNPFFLIEMARHLSSAEPTQPGARGIPPGARELVSRRVAVLPEVSRTVLELAAVLGLEFELGTVAGALGWPVSEVAAALQGPLAVGVVRALPDALQRYAFSHAITRDALCDELSALERSKLHLAIAEALERQEGEATERLPALSHHFFEAARFSETESGGEGVGEAERAVHWACEAGEHALARSALEEAAQHFQRAHEALALLGAPRDERRMKVALGLGLALHAGAQAKRGRELQQEAIEIARSLSPETFAQTVLRIALRRTEVALLDVETNALLEEALAGLPPEPSALRARLMARLAAGLYLERHAAERRRRISDESVAMARELGDPATVGFALSRRLMSLLSPDYLEERLATAEEMLAGPAIGVGTELEARLCQLDDLVESADRPALDAAFAAFEQRVESARRPFFAWQLSNARAALALLEGRLTEGEALAARALALGQRTQRESAGLQFAQQIFWLRGWQGRLPEIAPLIEGSAEKSRVVPAWRCGLAGFYCHVGREAEARRELEALAADDFQQLPRDGTWLTGMTLMADVCVRLGDESRAESLYRQLLPFAGRIVLARPLVVMTTTVAARLGMLAQLLGRFEEAESHLDAALRISEGMRALPFQADVRYRQAELLRQRGDRERALVRLEQSESLARPLGMNALLGWIETSRARVARAGARLSVAAGAGRATQVVREAGNVVRLERAPGPDGATGTFRREGDVWTLVFDGRSHRFKHMRGLAHLGRLVAEPGRAFHAAELAGVETAVDPGDAGPSLDAHARTAYRNRLREAAEELSEAERLNDRGRIDALVEEIEMLRAEMTRGYGIGGRERRAGSTSERARVAVTRAIKYALDKIEVHDPALAEHLRRSVRTGTFCVYEPSSRERVSWRL